MEIVIAVGAIVASVAPLYAMYLSLRKTSNAGYEESLERRLTRAEAELAMCRERCNQLEEENIALMKRILRDN